MARFKMQKIKVDQFAILTDTNPTGRIELKSDFETRAAKDSPIVTMSMRANLLAENASLLETLLLTCEFAIHPDDFKEMIHDDMMVIPASLISHMAMHVVGTARGILFCKNEGSCLSNLILPQVNVAAVFKDDVVVK